MRNWLKSAAAAIHCLKLSGTRLAFDRRLLALGLLQAWIFVVFHSALIIPVGAVRYDSAYSVAVITAPLMLIAGIVLHYHRTVRMYTLVVAVVIGVLGTLAASLLPTYGRPFSLVGPALVGASVGLILPFVGKLYSSLDLQAATIQTFASYAAGTMLYFLILGLPSTGGLVLTALLPVGLLVVFLLHRPPRHHTAVGTRDVIVDMITSRPIVMFFLGVALVGLAVGFSLALAGVYGAEVFGTANGWGILLCGLLAVACCLIALVSGKGFNFESYFRPVVPIIVIGFLAMRLSMVITGALIVVAFQFADMLIWIVLSWISSHSGLPQRVFCVGKASIYLGMLVGSLTAGLINPAPGSGSATETAATIVAYLLVLAVVYVFTNSNVTTAIKTSSDHSDLGLLTRALEIKCDELSKRYDLTARECEILGYLARGRSLPFIEAELRIAHGTASAHRDHIYSKLGVHSRQQLLNLFSRASTDRATIESGRL